MIQNEKETAKDASRGRLIFFLALLVICLVFNLGAAVLFEYYTVSASEGQIIFSMVMSWQLILFTAEIITIIIQITVIIRILRKYEEKHYNVIKYTGIAAAVLALIAAAAMVLTQGIKAAPAIFFTAYALFIMIVRAVVLVRVVASNSSLRYRAIA